MTRPTPTPLVPVPAYRQARPVKVLVWPHLPPPHDASQKKVEALLDTGAEESLSAGSVSLGEQSPETDKLPDRCSSRASGRDAAEASTVAGALLVPYEDAESCLFILQWPEDLPQAGCFVTFRVGPVGLDGLVVHADSIKLAGDWPAGSDLEWVLRGLPLAKMASKSPLGLVACRFKIWAQGWLSRRWLGRSAPVAVPSTLQAMQLGRTGLLTAQVRRGAAAEAAAKTSEVVDVRDGILPPTREGASGQAFKVVACPEEFLKRDFADEASDESGGSRQQEAVALSSAFAEALGDAVLDAAATRRWGLAKALLQELQRAPEVQRRRALAKADSTRKTALRMCVDALNKSKQPLLQALEGCTLRVLLGKTRQYWWCLRLKTVCMNTRWFNGQISIGVPRSRGIQTPRDVLSRTPLASSTDPSWGSCIWSKCEECDGKLEVDELATSPQLRGSFRLLVDGGHDVQLTLRFLGPGEVAAFGHGQLRNPLSFPLIAASGSVAGKPASGVCDPAACARLAAEMEESSPRLAAQLILDLGADPRALADDGLSPYTAAVLTEDPCGMLEGLDRGIRLRILRGDEKAWAEVARSAEGKGLPDVAAGALSRGLPIPESMAEELLEYCFQANLPLLTLRVLARIDGKRFLMPALQKAGSGIWLRVAERIVQQARPGQKPYWVSPEALKYAVLQIQAGRSQYRLLLDAFMSYLKASETEEFLANPCTLPKGRGGTECPICLEPLCRSTPTAFVDGADVAICLHFLCSNCARGYASSTNTQGEPLRCPECRRHAEGMRRLPSLCEDPLHWFEFLAGASDTASANGKVAKSMLLRTMSAILPIEADTIEAALQAGDLGRASLRPEVDASEFLTNDLFVWLWRHVQEHLRCLSLGPPPDLEEKRAWFKYWNLSESGRLSRAEVLRAIFRSFRVSSLDKQKSQEMRSRLDRVWDVWCQLGAQGHVDANSVTAEEFAADGGFGDVLNETFGWDPGGHDLHPAPSNEGAASSARLGSFLPGGRHPNLRGGRAGRLAQLNPRPKAAAAAWAAPPPDLLVPSETVALPRPLEVDVHPFLVHDMFPQGLGMFDPESSGTLEGESSTPGSDVSGGISFVLRFGQESSESQDLTPGEDRSPGWFLSPASGGDLMSPNEADEILGEPSPRETVVSL